MRLTQNDKDKLNAIVDYVLENPVNYFKIELTDTGRMVVVQDNETLADFFEMKPEVNIKAIEIQEN